MALDADRHSTTWVGRHCHIYLPSIDLTCDSALLDQPVFILRTTVLANQRTPVYRDPITQSAEDLTQLELPVKFVVSEETQMSAGHTLAALPRYTVAADKILGKSIWLIDCYKLQSRHDIVQERATPSSA